MSTATVKIIQLANEASEDELKFEKGNQSAGTRVRMKLQEIRKLCKDRRDEIQSKKNAE